MTRERWRKVRRAPGYKVSSDGRVRSLPRVLSTGQEHGGGLLTPYPDKDGYLCVTLNGETVRVHLLVLEAFHGPRPYGTEGCHGPDGLLDNRAQVLRWDTHRENLKDRERNKTRQPERLDWIGTHRPCLARTSEGGVPAAS